MTRSFTDRVLGGVCGGLGEVFPLNAFVWRSLFVLLTLIAPPAGIAVYLLLWWLFPQESLLQRRRSGLFNTLAALLLSLVIIIGWFARDSLRAASGADLYLPLAVCLLALVFVLRQFQTGVYQNVLMGLVALLIPVLFIIGGLELIPFGIFDVILRGLPAALVFFGVALLLRNRIPYGGVLALILSIGLTVGIATYAFSSRIDNVLDENQVTVSEPVAGTITTLQVNIEALATEVRFFSAAPDTRAITVHFSGSHESLIDHTLTDDGGGLATFTLRETRRSPYPRLESVGRGTMTVELPVGIAVSVAFAGADGNATFDMGALNLERLNIDLARGDALVTLPAYQPLSPGVAQNPGEFAIRGGNLRIIIPSEVGGRFVVPPNTTPAINEDLYRIEIAGAQWLIIARNYDSSPVKINYLLTVPHGTVRVDTTE